MPVLQGNKDSHHLHITDTMAHVMKSLTCRRSTPATKLSPWQ